MSKNFLCSILSLALLSFLFTACSDEGGRQAEPDFQQPSEIICQTRGMAPARAANDENGVWVLEEGEGKIGDKYFYNIKYIDFETGLMGYLCDEPGCGHNSDSCPSVISQNSGGSYIVRAGDKLITIVDFHSEEPSYINVSDPDGKNSRLITTFAPGRIIGKPEGGAYIAGENSLFVVAEEFALIDDDYNYSYTKQLVRVDLDTGRQRLVADIPANSFVSGVLDNKFLIWNYKAGCIYTIDLDGNESEKVQVMGVKNYFTYNGAAFAIDMDNKKLQRVNPDLSFTDIMDLPFYGKAGDVHLRAVDAGYLMAQNGVYDRDKNQWDMTLYSIDLESFEIKTMKNRIENDQKDGVFLPLAVTDKYVLAVVKQTDYDFVYQGHPGMYGHKTRNTYGIFTLEDFVNGSPVYTEVERLPS